MSNFTRCLIATAAMALALGVTLPVAAEETDPRSPVDLMYEDRIAELERAVEVLADELQRTRTALAVPEEPLLEGVYGLGPAASKVYHAGRGITFGGYGEAFYSNALSDRGNGTSRSLDRADMLRLVLYAGYRFTENIVFNSEIEFEHATTGSTESSSGGSASVEFAALDFFWKDWANFRAGLLLAPMGFINEIHEPPFFYGVNRPDVERVLIPTTWRELGTGLFGKVGEDIEYQAYVMNGFNGKGFDSKGVRGGRQKGNRVLAEHLAFVGQLNWYPTRDWLLGASLYVGNSGQNQRLATLAPGVSVGLPNALTTIWDVHSQFDWRRLHLRGLFTMTHIDQAGRLTSALRMVPDGTGTELGANEAIASWMLGGYAEVAYDILPLFFPETSRSLSPYYRYEFYDTQWDMPSGFASDDRRKIQVHTAGMQFKPIPSVVIKADYRNRQAERGQLADELNLGVGLVF